MYDKPIVLYRGNKFTVELAIRENNKSESKEYVDSLSKLDRAKIFKIIKKYADFGRVKSKEQFKKVDDDLWEFKDFQKRLLMYHCDRWCIALTHGFTKKRDKIPKNQIDRAHQIKKEYTIIRKGMTE